MLGCRRRETRIAIQLGPPLRAEIRAAPANCLPLPHIRQRPESAQITQAKNSDGCIDKHHKIESFAGLLAQRPWSPARLLDCQDQGGMAAPDWPRQSWANVRIWSLEGRGLIWRKQSTRSEAGMQNSNAF